MGDSRGQNTPKYSVLYRISADEPAENSDLTTSMLIGI